jgi:N-methylhydantoinase B
VAGNEVGAERLLRYLDDFELDNLEELSDEIISRSEMALREAIRQLPDGRYNHVSYTDGFEEPIRVEVTLEVAGDQIDVDFAGSSPQVERGFNVVLNYTAAYTHYALKCALCPEVPHNDGSFRPISVRAPEGSIFNPRFPAAVAARQIAGHFVPHAIFGALAPIIPDRVIAEGAGGIWLTTLRGRGSERFVSVFFNAGGTGARPSKDGLSATAFPSGVATAPVELTEATAPVIIRRKELRRDSGGAGQYRGGLGQTIDVEVRTGEPFVVSVLSDRFLHAAEGYAGGLPGAKAGFKTSNRKRGRPALSVALPAGTKFSLDLPGGGGYGNPSRRDLSLVDEDVREGLISRAAAKRDYGWDAKTRPKEST